MSDRPDARPTKKLARDEILRLVREADARASAVEAVSTAATLPPPPPDSRTGAAPDAQGRDAAADAPLQPTEAPTVHSSQPIERTDGDIAEEAEGPALTSIPSVLLTQEDLALFILKPASRTVLAAIDGVSTVEAILRRVTTPRAVTLDSLRQLGARGIVHFR
jgi:hypothetical protein